MRRGLFVVMLILGLVMAAPSVGAGRTLPALLAKQIRAIDAAATAPPVLLPRAMPLAARHLYPSGGASGRRYDLEIGAVRGCGGANACFVAAFTAAPGRTVFGKRVTVTGATRAGFTPLSCGASCSPPQIVFIVHGIRYTIQANLRKTANGDRATLVRAAESAISAGPR